MLVILNDPGKLPELLQAWQETGVSGVTVMESAGGYRTTTWLSAVGLFALDRLLEPDEPRRRTLLSAIDDRELLGRAVAEAERVVGASANVVVASMAERAGHSISFTHLLDYGFVATLFSLVMASLYVWLRYL